MTDPGLRLATLRAASKTPKCFWVYLSRYAYTTTGETTVSAGSNRVLLTPLAGVYGSDRVRTRFNGLVSLEVVFDTEAEALDYARLKLEDEIAHKEAELHALQSGHAKVCSHLLREKQKEAS